MPFITSGTEKKGGEKGERKICGEEGKTEPSPLKFKFEQAGRNPFSGRAVSFLSVSKIFVDEKENWRRRGSS